MGRDKIGDAVTLNGADHLINDRIESRVSQSPGRSRSRSSESHGLASQGREGRRLHNNSHSRSRSRSCSGRHHRKHHHKHQSRSRSRSPRSSGRKKKHRSRSPSSSMSSGHGKQHHRKTHRRRGAVSSSPSPSPRGNGAEAQCPPPAIIIAPKALVSSGTGEEGLISATPTPTKSRMDILSRSPHRHDATLMVLEHVQDIVTLPSPKPPPRTPFQPVMYGAAAAQGMRPYMEDRHTIVTDMTQDDDNAASLKSFAGIYDGHNGTIAADHAAKFLHTYIAANPMFQECQGRGDAGSLEEEEEEQMATALTDAFETLDDEIMRQCKESGQRGGATAVVVLRVGDWLYAAHAGDSRAVLCRNGEALRLTEDHKPNVPRERKRVEGLGGRVDYARCWRVIVDPGDGRPASGLAVSRSFGDPDFKMPKKLVTATPDVIRERLEVGDTFFIMASDGLWDVLTDAQACEIVGRHMEASVLSNGGGGGGGGGRVIEPTQMVAATAASALVDAALRAGTMDNVTAIVALLRPLK